MKKFFKEIKIISVFLLLLTGFTVVSYLDSSTEKIMTTKSLEEINHEIVKVKPLANRTPAAINNLEIDSDILTLNDKLLCQDTIKNISKTVTKHMVLMNFKICDSLKNAVVLSLKNESNGFKAQIFKLEQNNYKTDYIQLNQGMNKIKLEAVLKDGQKLTESLEILSGS